MAFLNRASEPDEVDQIFRALASSPNGATVKATVYREFDAHESEAQRLAITTSVVELEVKLSGGRAEAFIQFVNMEKERAAERKQEREEDKQRCAALQEKIRQAYRQNEIEVQTLNATANDVVGDLQAQLRALELKMLEQDKAARRARAR